MGSTYHVRQVSRGDGPALHCYYDVCPESPDGSRIIYFEFAGDSIPGTGRVIVADRDGRNAEPVTDFEEGIGHVGAFPQWLTDDAFAYHKGPHKGGHTVIRSLADGTERTLPGSVRQLHLAADRALVQVMPESPDNPHKLCRLLQVRRLSDGEALNTITIEQVYELYEGQDDLPASDQFQMQNTKFSPDARTFLFVFTNEVYRVAPGVDEPRRGKAIYLADVDGTNVRFLADFTHHPIWAPDGRGVLAMTAPGQSPERQDLVEYRPGCAPRVLLSDALGVHGSPHPDGRRMVIDAFGYPTEGGASLLLYDLSTGDFEVAATFAHTRFDHETGHHPHPVWSRDGRSVYFNAMDSGRCQLYRMDVD